MKTKSYENTKSCIILLSGGVDCCVSLAQIVSSFDNILAFTFDYGQKAFQKELLASKRIAKYFDIEHKVLKLPYIEELIVKYDSESMDQDQNEFRNIWVPNRNALFLNICAAYCDSLKISNIAIGINREEAQDFKDNSLEFIDAQNKVFEYSTIFHPKVIAPVGNLNKKEIVKKGLELGAPLQYINSCYDLMDRHCGNCPSCKLLKKALIENEAFELINIIF